MTDIQHRKKPLFVLAGATTSGKTDLAKKLANQYSFEIVSADSRQVYQGLDIGTGKDKTVPQAMIDVVKPGDLFSVSHYKIMATRAIDRIYNRGHIPLIVGGTGFYIDALIYQESHNTTPANQKIRHLLETKSNTQLLEEIAKTDPKTAALIDRHNRVRLIRALEIIRLTKTPLMPLQKVLKAEYDPHIFVIDMSGAELYGRIDQRLDMRLTQGLVQEVEALLHSGVPAKWLSSLGLEYRFITQYVQKEMTYPKMQERLKYAIHAYARRQLSYFRRWPDAQWLNAEIIQEKIRRIISG